MAQLVARLHGMEEVWGSNPHSSTRTLGPVWSRTPFGGGFPPVLVIFSGGRPPGPRCGGLSPPTPPFWLGFLRSVGVLFWVGWSSRLGVAFCRFSSLFRGRPAWGLRCGGLPPRPFASSALNHSSRSNASVCSSTVAVDRLTQSDAITRPHLVAAPGRNCSPPASVAFGKVAVVGRAVMVWGLPCSGAGGSALRLWAVAWSLFGGRALVAAGRFGVWVTCWR